MALKVAGGGSGLNTVVIVNQNSTNSAVLANYYCERRQVPPENVLRISWTGANLSWSSDEFQTNLLSPLVEMLASRQLTNQIDYLVLSMDIPFQVAYGSVVNSTTAALYYGLKPDRGVDWKGVTNSYAWSEGIFRESKPASAPGPSFLTTMLTGRSLPEAQALVDQGVNGDSTSPTRPVLLAKTSDLVRGIRANAFDNAIFNTRLLGNCALWQTNSDSLGGQTNLLGYQTGLMNLSLPQGTFLPGAMADNLTSYGGLIFGPNNQTTLLDFINAGAAGSYGTVTEPSPDPQKFPDPQDYFFQARGYSLAEAYYQSLDIPFEGLIVGEPLTAPFAHPGTGAWVGSQTPLRGTVPLSVSFSAADSQHPLQQIDLFIDGKYSRTLTNLAPRPGNVLTIAFNGYPVTYTVPAGASLRSVAAGIADLLNSPAVSTVTKTAALLHGDRIELRSFSTNLQTEPFYFNETTGSGGSQRFYRVRYLPGPVVPQFRAISRDGTGVFRLQTDAVAGMSYSIQASTNLSDWSTIAADVAGGPLDFRDLNAPAYPRRFYRLAGVVPEIRPRLFLAPDPFLGLSVQVEMPTAHPYTLQFSTDLIDWHIVATNSAGSSALYSIPPMTSASAGFYRAGLLPLPPAPHFTIISGIPGPALLRIDGAIQPYVIEMSSDLANWIPVLTNFANGAYQTTTSNNRGAADIASSFLSVCREGFLSSPARGFRTVSANGTFEAGSWLQLNVTRTNGQTVILSVTNQSVAGTLLDLGQQLVQAVNAEPDLQGPDGVDAEDLTSNAFGASLFNLRARGSGIAAAGVQAQLAGSSSLVLSPAAPATLTANSSDLQPRNHLYVKAGSLNLTVDFLLDTTSLADGQHEFTAVAYEGSHVRTQTRTSRLVQVQNSPLTAAMTLLDLGDSSPAQGTYHVQVAANAANISSIKLFSTGGLLDVTTNQPTSTFLVSGRTLAAGRHPFYAVVETTSGQKYRTPVRWVRLVN